MSARMRNAVRLTIAGSLSLSAVACYEPSPKCNIARGKFAVKYVMQSATGTPECTGLVGDMWQADVYYQRTSASDPQPNPDHAYVALQPATLTGAISRAGSDPVSPVSDSVMTDKPYVFGEFAESKPKDGVCTMPTLSAAHIKLPAVAQAYDMMCMYYPAQDAVDVTYTLSNLQVYVTPEANGTQFTGTLVYSTPTCSATYTVTGLSPYVPCGAAAASSGSPATGSEPDGGIADASAQGMDASVDIDAGGSLLDANVGDASADGGGTMESDGGCTPPAAMPAAPMTADSTACDPFGNPSKAVQPSGISPEFATTCDPQLLTCVPSGAFPSLKP